MSLRATVSSDTLEEFRESIRIVVTCSEHGLVHTLNDEEWENHGYDLEAVVDNSSCTHCRFNTVPIKKIDTTRKELIRRGVTLKRKIIMRRDAPRRGKPRMYGPIDLEMMRNIRDPHNSFAFKGN